MIRILLAPSIAALLFLFSGSIAQAQARPAQVALIEAGTQLQFSHATPFRYHNWFRVRIVKIVESPITVNGPYSGGQFYTFHAQRDMKFVTVLYSQTNISPTPHYPFYYAPRDVASASAPRVTTTVGHFYPPWTPAPQGGANAVHYHPTQSTRAEILRYVGNLTASFSQLYPGRTLTQSISFYVPANESVNSLWLPGMAAFLAVGVSRQAPTGTNSTQSPSTTPASPAGLLSPRPLADGATYQVGFSPGPTAEDLVLDAIRSAHSSILCAAYDFTSHQLAAALIARAQAGVAVSIVADAREARTRYSDLARLARGGVKVRLDSHYAAMHDKFMIIDRRDVETGSFNYSYSAYRRNAENVIVVWNAPRLAASYVDAWTMLWRQSSAWSR